MALDPGVYCGLSDLLLGDLTLPRYAGDGSQFVNRAAEVIDARLGHIYKTPIAIPVDPKFRPSALILKQINELLASGRIILDMAAAAEDNNLHAYGRQLMREGEAMLHALEVGDRVLQGADTVDSNDTVVLGPKAIQTDSVSLVEQFYAMGNPHNWPCVNPVQPYE